MRKPIIVAFVVFGLLSFGIASTGFAQEGEESAETETEDFKELTQKAAEAYRAEDYETAAEFFERAYAVKPVPNLLYNIGRAYEKMGNFEDAVAYYERFANEPDVDMKARRDAIDRADTLSKVVERRKSGEEVDEDEVAAKQGDAQLASTQTEIKRDYTLAYIFTGVGVGALGVGTAFAIQAGNAHDDFEDAESRQDLEDARTRGERSSLVADTMLGVGVVMAGLGTYFFLSPPESQVPVGRAEMRISPQFGADRAGMSLTLDF